MHNCTDIRAHVQADAQLQTEISAALLAVADGLAGGVDLRMVRILTRTLEASWAEHVSFQDGVVFPILFSWHGAKFEALIGARRSEHTHLADLHSQIGRRLERLLQPDHAMDDDLEATLRHAHADRISHMEFDSQIDRWLPEAFSDADRSLCEKWSATRPSPRFPLNLLPKGDRPFPKLGDRIH